MNNEIFIATPSPPLPLSGESNIEHFACSQAWLVQVSPLGASYQKKCEVKVKNE